MAYLIVLTALRSVSLLFIFVLNKFILYAE